MATWSEASSADGFETVSPILGPFSGEVCDERGKLPRCRVGDRSGQADRLPEFGWSIRGRLKADVRIRLRASKMPLIRIHVGLKDCVDRSVMLWTSPHAK
jgi:hypothetical protein